MTYPATWTDLKAARQVWTPPAEIEADFDALRASPVEYLFCIGAFDLLAPIVAELDNDGVGIALGAAARINAVQFDGRQAEALAFIVANAGRYTAPEIEPPPL